MKTNATSLQPVTVFTVVAANRIMTEVEQTRAREILAKVLRGDPIEATRGWEVCVDVGVASACINSN